MATAAILEEQIINYYDACHRDFQFAWHLNSHLSMHYGYWSRRTSNLKEALQNLDRKVARMAQIKNHDLVLDAGCGVGGSAIYLAQNHSCRVEGITLSQKQVDFAINKALEYQVGDRTNFSVANYCNTPFAADTFDVVWAIESVCHAPEKDAFLQEAYRILKPGGRLIVVDFFYNHRNDSNQNNLMAKWASAVAIPQFEFFTDFLHKAHKVGFDGIKTKNITKNIRPSARRLYFLHYPAIICYKFLDLIGKGSELNVRNAMAALYQYQALKENLWSYQMLSAVK